MAKPDYSDAVDSEVSKLPSETFTIETKDSKGAPRKYVFSKGDRSPESWAGFIKQRLAENPDAVHTATGEESVAAVNDHLDDKSVKDAEKPKPEEYDAKKALEMTRDVKAENDKKDRSTMEAAVERVRETSPFRDQTGPITGSEREKVLAKMAGPTVSPVTGPEREKVLAEFAAKKAAPSPAAEDAAKYVHEYAPNAAAQEAAGVVSDVSAPTPAEPGFFDRAKNAIVDAANSPTADKILQFGNGIAGLTGGQQYPLANAPPQQALASTQAPPPVAPPTAPVQPTAAPPPAPPTSAPVVGSNQKLSAGDVGEQGQMQADPSDPYAADPLIQQVRANTKDEAAAVNAQADAEMKQHDARLDARRELMLKQAKLDLDEREATQKANEVMEKGLGAYQRLQAQVLDASRTEINPGRYWQNKDAGQKAAAVIAGALFGFTGQGMNYLQHLDSLVEQDINAQKADIANRREGLQNAVRGQENYLQMAHAHGLEGIAAVNAARAAAYKDFEQKALMAADQFPAARDHALQMAAEIKNKGVELELKIRSDLEKSALAAMQAKLRASGAAKAPKIDKESAGLVKETERIEKSAKDIVRMTTDWKENGTGFWAGVGARIPGDVGTSVSAAKGLADRNTTYADEIAPGVLAGTTPTQREIEQLKDNSLPKPTISDKESTKRIEQLMHSNIDKYRANYKARLEAGHPVSSMQTPDEYEAYLRSEVARALSGKKVPGEKAVQ